MTVAGVAVHGDVVAHGVGRRGGGKINGTPGVIGGAEHTRIACRGVCQIAVQVLKIQANGLLGIGAAFRGAAHAPVAFYGVAQGVQTGALALVVRYRLQKAGIQQHIAGQKAGVADRVLLVLVYIKDRVPSGLTTA